MKLIIIIVFMTGIFQFGIGQTVLLERQSQVDSFVCTNIIHSLQIGSALEDSDIADVSKLYCITDLVGAGLVVVNNPKLKSLDGLHNIKAINGALIIRNNDSLINLTGLPSQYILTEPLDYWRYISIIDNDMLTSLEGFPYVSDLSRIGIGGNTSLSTLEHIPYIDGLDEFGLGTNSLTDLTSLPEADTIYKKLTIAGVDIMSLHGFDSLEFCQEVHIKGATGLSNLEGLGSLDSIRLLTIESCSNMVDMVGLDSIRTIFELKLIENNQLQNLVGLENLKKLEYRLFLDNNPGIVDVEGLESLEELGSIVAIDNPNLSSIDEVGATILTGGITIQNCDALEHINKVQAIGNTTITDNLRLKNYGPFPNAIPFNALNIEITNNDSLTTVEGLLGLERVEGELLLFDNPILEDLSGLDSLGYAQIINLLNTNIKNVKNLVNIDSVELSLLIGSNNIKDLLGLENWQFAGGGPYLRADSLENIDAIAFSQNFKSYTTLIFDECFSLKSIYGFNQTPSNYYLNEFRLYNTGILTVGGLSDIDSIKSFRISYNDDLKSIIGLENLKSLSSSINYFHTNPALTDISGLCKLFTEGTIAGDIEIHDNAVGFNTQEEIVNWCMTPTEDLPTWDAIVVYPNPASDALYFEVPYELIQVGIELDIVDISGVSHFFKKIQSTVSDIPINNLKPGLYFLRITYDGRLTQVKKVVVE